MLRAAGLDEGRGLCSPFPAVTRLCSNRGLLSLTPDTRRACGVLAICEGRSPTAGLPGGPPLDMIACIRIIFCVTACITRPTTFDQNHGTQTLADFLTRHSFESIQTFLLNKDERNCIKLLGIEYREDSVCDEDHTEGVNCDPTRIENNLLLFIYNLQNRHFWSLKFSVYLSQVLFLAGGNQTPHLVAFMEAEYVSLQRSMQLTRLSQRHLLHDQLFHQRLVLLLQLLNLRQHVEHKICVPFLISNDRI